MSCAGYPSNIHPARPARLCTRCASWDRLADKSVPGFAGSECQGFVHVSSVNLSRSDATPRDRDGEKHMAPMGVA